MIVPNLCRPVTPLKVRQIPFFVKGIITVRLAKNCFLRRAVWPALGSRLRRFWIPFRGAARLVCDVVRTSFAYFTRMQAEMPALRLLSQGVSNLTAVNLSKLLNMNGDNSC